MASPADWSIQASSRTCTRTSLESPRTPTRSRPVVPWSRGPVVIGISRGAQQRPAFCQLPEPVLGDGKADLQLHLIADKHLTIFTGPPGRAHRDLGPDLPD